MTRLRPALAAAWLLAAPLAGQSIWPPPPQPPFVARDLTTAGRFTKNAEGPEFTRAG